MPNPPKKFLSRITKPSSQVKKAPKEGSRKFVGPRSQSGLLAEEVLATNPPLYRQWTPKPSPKNRQASTKGKPDKRNPKDVPSAVTRAKEAGRDVNRQRFTEMVNAVNKLPPNLRKKLRDALKAGVRSRKNISIYNL
jgi:hypothetical protein